MVQRWAALFPPKLILGQAALDDALGKEGGVDADPDHVSFITKTGKDNSLKNNNLHTLSRWLGKGNYPGRDWFLGRATQLPVIRSIICQRSMFFVLKLACSSGKSECLCQREEERKSLTSSDKLETRLNSYIWPYLEGLSTLNTTFTHSSLALALKWPHLLLDLWPIRGKNECG